MAIAARRLGIKSISLDQRLTTKEMASSPMVFPEVSIMILTA
jgi:hypothetical protein